MSKLECIVNSKISVNVMFANTVVFIVSTMFATIKHCRSNTRACKSILGHYKSNVRAYKSVLKHCKSDTEACKSVLGYCESNVRTGKSILRH